MENRDIGDQYQQSLHEQFEGDVQEHYEQNLQDHSGQDQVEQDGQEQVEQDGQGQVEQDGQAVDFVLPLVNNDTEIEYKIGDIIWAKIGGCPYWPSIVCYDPIKNLYFKSIGEYTYYKYTNTF